MSRRGTMSFFASGGDILRAKKRFESNSAHAEQAGKPMAVSEDGGPSLLWGGPLRPRDLWV